MLADKHNVNLSSVAQKKIFVKFSFVPFCSLNCEAVNNLFKDIVLEKWFHNNKI